MSLQSSVRLLPALACMIVASCIQGQTKQGKTETMVIDRLKAERLAAQRYRQLFGDKYYQGAKAGNYRLFPVLQDDFFTQVKQTKTHWQLSGEPPAGLFVRANVALDGTWVDVLDVGFASE